MEKYEDALSVYNQAYKGAREMGNARLLGLAARGLAGTFVRKNQMEPGELKIVEAVEIFSKLGDTESQKAYLQQYLKYAEKMDATYRVEYVANELAKLS